MLQTYAPTPDRDTPNWWGCAGGAYCTGLNQRPPASRTSKGTSPTACPQHTDSSSGRGRASGAHDMSRRTSTQWCLQSESGQLREQRQWRSRASRHLLSMTAPPEEVWRRLLQVQGFWPHRPKLSGSNTKEPAIGGVVKLDWGSSAEELLPTRVVSTPNSFSPRVKLGSVTWTISGLCPWGSHLPSPGGYRVHYLPGLPRDPAKLQQITAPGVEPHNRNQIASSDGRRPAETAPVLVGQHPGPLLLGKWGAVVDVSRAALSLGTETMVLCESSDCDTPTQASESPVRTALVRGLHHRGLQCQQTPLSPPSHSSWRSRRPSTTSLKEIVRI